jgi:hypothetical protein
MTHFILYFLWSYLDMTQCAMSPLAGDSGYSSSIRSAMHDVLYIVSIRHLYTKIREIIH